MFITDDGHCIQERNVRMVWDYERVHKYFMVTSLLVQNQQ
jgi:hypothetical protein